MIRAINILQDSLNYEKQALKIAERNIADHGKKDFEDWEIKNHFKNRDEANKNIPELELAIITLLKSNNK